MTDHPILVQLREALPDLRLLTTPEDTAPFTRDETEFVPHGQPLAAAFPTTTAEVSTVVSRVPGCACRSWRAVAVPASPVVPMPWMAASSSS